MSRYHHVMQPVVVESFVSPAVVSPLRAKHFVSIDPVSRELLSTLDRVAPSQAPVQVTGETGTGKELIARHIHRQSNRTGPFLPVNCGAISEQLAESEFFGHEAGSFTGATSRREGWFEAANGGTLFLDEIGDMPLALQGKLLRALQEGEVTRIGARRPIPVDVRIVSATNVDLEAAVRAGRFRRDLYYRLNVVAVSLPALRDRPGDIAALAQHFAILYSAKLKRPVPAFSAEALVKLAGHSWPGNIRELENVVHCAMLMTAGAAVVPDDIRLGAGGWAPAPIATAKPAGTLDARSGAAACPSLDIDRVGEAIRACFSTPGQSLLRDVEGRLVEDAFRHCDSNQVRTADLLGVSRNVVRTLLKRYGLILDGGGLEDRLCPRSDFGAGLGNRPFALSSH